ncbi:MAG: sugar transferase [Bacteroidetes bacterium]|nr:sugar transferase [Bacteroidota bacterium]
MSYFFFKRFFDLLFSVLVIVFVLSWALPLMALLIKLDSRGPVFFFQKRIGKGGRPFICIKMRTMVVNPQADQVPAGREDGRVTRMGKWLRCSYLDELPQFFNVLLGSMSLVGPRPYMLTDNQVFSRIVAEHPMRYTIKPGITGMAQIKGLHGPLSERDGAVIVTRFQWDIFYIRNANFLLDIDIIRRSIHLLFTQQMRA